ncbi:MAG: hypothetical protein V4696_03910 [Pseudomonadota bacterium]
MIHLTYNQARSAGFAAAAEAIGLEADRLARAARFDLNKRMALKRRPSFNGKAS